MSPVAEIAICVGLLLIVGFVGYCVLRASARAEEEAAAMERQLITDRLARISEDKTR